jgi:hypothetical protein
LIAFFKVYEEIVHFSQVAIGNFHCLSLGCVLSEWNWTGFPKYTWLKASEFEGYKFEE